jgi:hypothetical protein
MFPMAGFANNDDFLSLLTESLTNVKILKVNRFYIPLNNLKLFLRMS